MWVSSAIPFILPSANSYCYFRTLFMYHALYFSMLIFILHVPCFPFKNNRSQSKVSVDNQVSHLFFEAQKIFFAFFQLFENCLQNFVSTLVNFVKLDVKNGNIVSALSDVANINVEIDNINLTLLNVVNFNVYIHVVSTLIWYYPTLRSHIALTTTLRQRWNVFWVLKNVSKSLHNFVKFVKLETYIFSRIPLKCCSRKLSKRYC